MASDPQVDARARRVAAVFADDHIVVIDKPAGLLAVPGRGAAGALNLAALVQAQWPDAAIVHRLDMATSGLIVFARGALVQRRLSLAFAARDVAKRYVALVHGDVAPDTGSIDLPIGAHWQDRPRRCIDPVRGKPSQTTWRVIERHSANGHTTTRLELEPVTGRTHQLRVHLAAIGHPIVGDALYGTDGDTRPRVMLHATRLGFAHPASGEPCVFESAAPF